MAPTGLLHRTDGPQLRIGPANGVAEREADRAAESVARGEPAPALSRPDAGGATVSEATSQDIQSPGPGAPIHHALRPTLEAGVGADLSGVRVHDDARAHGQARDLGARAFTHGEHVHLGAHASASDAALLAHEAAHVVQQRKAGAPALVQRQPDEDWAHEPSGPGHVDVLADGTVRLWNFAQGDAHPKSEHLLALDRLQAVLSRTLGANWPSAIKSVIGFTSPEGSEASNDTLSAQRASTVADHLDFLVEQSEGRSSTARWQEGAGELSGKREAWPSLRRVDIEVASVSTVEFEPEPVQGTAPVPKPPGEITLPEEDTTLKDVFKTGYDVTDSVVTVVDTAASALGAGSELAAGSLSMLAGAALAVQSVRSWAGALETGDNIDWCLGASYAFVALARGEDPPPYPAGRAGSFSDESRKATVAAWQTGVADVRKRIADDPAAWKRMVAAVRQSDATAMLNVVYQDLVEERLDETFLGFMPAGGVGYDQARSYKLAWPGPSWK